MVGIIDELFTEERKKSLLLKIGYNFHKVNVRNPFGEDFEQEVCVFTVPFHIRTNYDVVRDLSFMSLFSEYKNHTVDAVFQREFTNRLANLLFTT